MKEIVQFHFNWLNKANDFFFEQLQKGSEAYQVNLKLLQIKNELYFAMANFYGQILVHTGGKNGSVDTTEKSLVERMIKDFQEEVTRLFERYNTLDIPEERGWTETLVEAGTKRANRFLMLSSPTYSGIYDELEKVWDEFFSLKFYGAKGHKSSKKSALTGEAAPKNLEELLDRFETEVKAILERH
jgi:hypothetical protein